MNLFSKLFRSRDKPKDYLSIHWPFLFGGTAAGRNVNESIHCAGSNNGKYLADCIQTQIVEYLRTVDRGVKMATPGKNGLYVLTNTDMPAVLVELAFISNEDDEKLLRNEQDEFARAIARGVTDYM